MLNALIEGEEKERSRLARELHDGVGGILSASRMHLSLLQEDQPNGSHADGLTHISSMLDQASQEIRSIAHNLFPDLLEMHPLDVAVGNYCQRVRNAGLNLDYYYLGARNEISTPLKLAIYRSVQELVNNSIKHARASHVLVQLSQHENTLQLTVEDNGAGFDPDKVVGMGLLSLKNKITKLGGQLSIESCPGKGTTVHIEIDFATNENSVHDSLSVNA